MPPRRRHHQPGLDLGSAFRGYEEDEGMLLTGLERYFCGGCNTQQDIRGCLESGSDVGLCAADLTTEGEAELMEWLSIFGPHPYHYDWRIFLDSGAFSEVDFSTGVPRITRPITEDGWRERFDLYDRLALAGGARLHVVAPDRVADQRYTLELLQRWRVRILRLWAFNARIIVPVQKGPHFTMANFREAAMDVLGLGEGIIWGIPSKKDATNLEDIAAFAGSLPPGSSVHFLGMGPHSPGYERARHAVLSRVPGAEVWSDSVRLRAVAGEGRPLTEETRIAEQEGHPAPRSRAVFRVLRQDVTVRIANAKAAGWKDDGEE